MAFSAAALVNPNNLFSDFRRRRGYNKLVWGREFGSAKSAYGASIPIRSLSELWDQSYGGFSPNMEPFNFTGNNLAGNWEPQRGVNAGNIGGSTTNPFAKGNRAPTYGQNPHLINASNIELSLDLHANINSDQKLIDTFFKQNPYVGTQYSLAPSGTITLTVDDVANPQVGLQYQIAPGYQRNACVVATLTSWVSNGNGTATATFTKNYTPDGAVTGLHNQLNFQALVYETGYLSTRSQLAPDYYGYWETRIWLPPGKGIWPAWWLIRNNAWPPEIDMIEVFRELDSELNNIHSGVIEAVSGGSWSQRFRTHSNYCLRDGVGKSTFEIDWGYDVTGGFHTVGIELCRNGSLCILLDTAMGKSIIYKWVVHKNWAANNIVDPPTPALLRGDEQAMPHMVFNNVIGPVMDAYRPNNIARFPSKTRIEYVRYWQRKVA